MFEAPLAQSDLEMLHRLVRDARRDVREAACEALGRLAAEDGQATAMVQSLLDCPVPELRLRGVTALRALAPSRPADVAAFVQLVVSASDIDPIFLEAVASLLPALPREFACSELNAWLRDERPSVRAAAAASLSGWGFSTPGTLLALARDPAPYVRAALATSLSALGQDEEVLEAWRLLAQSPEDYVRAFVAEEMRAQGLAEVKPAALPSMQKIGVDAMIALEAALEPSDDAGMAPLFEKLDGPDGIEVLHAISWLARDTAVSATCVAVHALLAGGTDRLSVARLALTDARAPYVESLRGFITLCEQAQMAATPAAVQRWAYAASQQVHAVPCAMAQSALAGLIEVGAFFPYDGAAAALSEAAAGVEDLVRQAQTALPAPERAVLRAVLDAWTEILDGHIENALLCA
ncbi:MAG: hypothetical protein FJX76_22310 [Armatimonadetes bacterium]|nr:hypothetical protein [Armatimonadota bacterium]